jgi:hypothetical protein
MFKFENYLKEKIFKHKKCSKFKNVQILKKCSNFKSI